MNWTSCGSNRTWLIRPGESLYASFRGVPYYFHCPVGIAAASLSDRSWEPRRSAASLSTGGKGPEAIE